MNERTRKSALKALDGMEEIVTAEMLMRGEYFSSYVADPSRKQAICGGRKFCAIGALWQGAGIGLIREPRERDNIVITVLPGAMETVWRDYLTPNNHQSRADFLVRRPGLRLALDTLDAVAQEFAADAGLDLSRGDYASAMEALFEGEDEDGDFYVNSEDLLDIIRAARREIVAA